MCDGDRYDDRVTEIVDAALERGYTLAFRQRAGGWEAAWRPDSAESRPPVSPPFAPTPTAPAPPPVRPGVRPAPTGRGRAGARGDPRRGLNKKRRCKPGRFWSLRRRA